MAYWGQEQLLVAPKNCWQLLIELRSRTATGCTLRIGYYCWVGSKAATGCISRFGYSIWFGSRTVTIYASTTRFYTITKFIEQLYNNDKWKIELLFNQKAIKRDNYWSGDYCWVGYKWLLVDPEAFDSTFSSIWFEITVLRYREKVNPWFRLGVCWYLHPLNPLPC